MLKHITIGVLAITFGFLHYKYVSNIFENYLNFSHLSKLEREMALRTEMGFYYSYYKTIVETQPFFAGISKLMYDKLVEYPKEVNAFNRFNVHPEVIIGSVYRYLEPILNDTSKRQCIIVDRGEGHGVVQSCTDMGEPIMFYLEVVWYLAGLTVGVLFLHAVTLSNSITGGVLSVLHYFANHAEATRVQWAPNERENIAMPFLLLQTWLLTLQLRDTKRKFAFQLQISIFILNCLCLLFWQFAQFIFLTQMAIYFLMEQLYIIDVKSLSIFLHSHFCGLHMAVLLLQGNDMLKASLYTSLFLVISAYCLFFSSLRVKVRSRRDLLLEISLIGVRMLLVLCLSLLLKRAIGELLAVQEDSHVWDILYSKFTAYRTFHTMIYTCSDVFDFMPWSTVRSLFSSLLIPVAVLNTCSYVSSVLVDGCNRAETGPPPLSGNANGEAAEAPHSDPTDPRGDPTAPHPEPTAPLLDHTDPTATQLDCTAPESDPINPQSDATTPHSKPVDPQSEPTARQLNLIDRQSDPATPQSDPAAPQSDPAAPQSDPAPPPDDRLVAYLKCLDPDPAVVYNIAQMLVFGAMALLVMRLKLLLVTQMCLIASLVMNKNHLYLPSVMNKYLPIFYIVFTTPTLNVMLGNISDEYFYMGEFSDYPQEELLQWIAREAGSGAFAGSMPILASVMLSTRKPIVVHPHYEHLATRQRAYAVYKVYGRFTPEELYRELNKIEATYLIVENKYCYGRSNNNCSFGAIWDVQSPMLSKRPLLCHILLTEHVEHFYPVFRNGEYAVFMVHDVSVRYMPRSFDT
ncbi:unnamed protein product, partial [Iphiclides podalirius]